MSAESELTPAACLEGSVAAARNARRLVLAASSLRRSGHRGPAVALYVTSVEEAIKSLALYLGSEITENGRVRPEFAQTLNGLLRGPNSHIRRHAVASLGELLQSLSSVPSDSQPARGAWVVFLLGLVFLVLSGDRKVLDDFLAAAATAGLNVGPEMRTGWFQKASDERQRGLYVDWHRGAWRSPEQITQADVLNARRAVDGIVRMVLWIVREPFTAEESAALRDSDGLQQLLHR